MSDMQEHQSLKRHYLMLAFILSLSIVILLIAGILIIKPKIESDLTEKVTEQLKRQGIVAQVSFSGRDGVIKGIVKRANVKKAEKSAYEVCGIHFIDNQLIAKEEKEVIAKAMKEGVISSSQIESKLQNATQEVVITPPSSLERSNVETTETKQESVRKGGSASSSDSDDKAANKNHVGKKTIGERKEELVSGKKSADKNTLGSSKDIKEKVTENISETKKLADNIPDKIVSSESGTSKHSAKGNLLAYEKMLTAMDDYNKNKNAKSRNNPNGSDKPLFNIDTTAINFISDSTKIKPGSFKVLDRLAEELKKLEGENGIKITVTAKESDLAFGRAKNVQSYLIGKGIKKNQLVITGKGDLKGHAISITKLQD